LPVGIWQSALVGGRRKRRERAMAQLMRLAGLLNGDEWARTT
jgi:hypothetical protein